MRMHMGDGSENMGMTGNGAGADGPPTVAIRGSNTCKFWDIFGQNHAF